jgi:uncharacterized membrane protein
MNFMFLGVVSFIPFPTALMSEHPDQALSVIIFSACYALAGLVLGGMWILMERTEDSSERPAQVPRSVTRVIVLLPVLAVIASLLTLVDPRLGVGVWIIMPFLGIGIRHR